MLTFHLIYKEVIYDEMNATAQDPARELPEGMTKVSVADIKQVLDTLVLRRLVSSYAYIFATMLAGI